MTQIEEENKKSGEADDVVPTGSSEGAVEFYIDPVKERNMMRKFDVCRPAEEIVIKANWHIVLLYWHDGYILPNGKLGSVSYP